MVATFQATRTKRMDLITDTAQGFYANFAHKRMAGFPDLPGRLAAALKNFSAPIGNIVGPLLR